MRRAATLAFGLAIVLLVSDFVSTQSPRPGRRLRTEIVDGHEVVAGEVLVRFREGSNRALREEEADARVEADEVEHIGRQGLRRMHARRLGTRALIASLQQDPEVELVEPNYVIRVDATPNDPNYGSLWGLKNIGQNIGGVGIVGADTSASLAWDLTTGTRGQVVGVIDTGIDYNHPDLVANIWSAPSAFSVTLGGGVVINCAAGTHGFNAITNTCNPMDDHYHGTHVSGTIGAVGNNGVGVAGVNWTASLMGLKFLSSSGSGSISDAIKAIDFAVQAKAAFAGSSGANVRVLSNSWGGGGYSQALKDAIDRANVADMLFVAAAGNSASNNDAFPNYPSNYASANMVAVAATDNRDLLASFSSYGATTVHLGAPGVNVLSTTPGNTYSYLNGTSMATPHVSGAAALLLSRCAFTTAALKTALLNSVDPVAALVGKTTTGGRLNINAAMRACTPPVLQVNGGSVPITVGQGASVTMGLTDGPGAPGDWLSLARTSDANSVFNQWTYVGPGTTARTWTVTMPAELGTYEFRIFSNNTFTRLAASPVVTVAALNPVPVASSLQPSSYVAGSDGFTIIVTGSGFVPASVVTVDGASRTTVYVSATTLMASIPASDMASVGTHAIAVVSPTPGGGTSAALTLTITAPPAAPTISSLGTTSVTVGQPITPITVTGTNFIGTSLVRVDGVARSTTYGSPTSLTFLLLPADIALNGTHAITVVTPSPGGGTSNAVSLTVVGPTLTPSVTTTAPGSSVTVTLANGAGAPGDWLSLALTSDPNPTFAQWTYVGAGVTSRTWTVTAPTTLGNYEFRLFSNNTFTRVATSAALAVANLNPVPAIGLIQPASIAAGSSAFTLSVTGTGFVSTSVVSIDGSPRTTTYVSPTSLTAMITASDVNAIASHAITVVSPSPGGGTSGAATLAATPAPAAPTISNLSPASVPMGQTSTPIVVTGANFVGTSVVRVDGAARATTFVNATTLSVMLVVGDVAAAATRQISVMTPAPGGGTSGTLPITVVGPTLIPDVTTVAPGSSVTVTLANGPGAGGDWLSIARTSDPNPTFSNWIYVGAGIASRTWTVNMPAALGTYEFRLFSNNTFTRLATSAAITVANVNPVPVMGTIQPVNVAAGSASLTMTVTGSGFTVDSSVRVDGSTRTTSFVSATTLIGMLPSGDVASIGTRSITVFTPSPGGGTSSAATLSVIAPPPAPAISNLSPSSVATGQVSTPIVVTGANFTGTSTVFVDGAARATAFGSSTSLTFTLMAADVAMAGTRQITVVTPAPGGGTSSALPLTVVGPALGVSATNVAPGAAVTATLTSGPGAMADWLALARVGDPAQTFVAWTYVGGGSSMTWPVTMPTTIGSYEFRLFSNNTFMLLATSPVVTVANINPVPVVGSLQPAAIAAGSAAFTLTVMGSGFAPTSTVSVGGTPRSTMFVSSSVLTVAMTAGDVSSVGTRAITVVTPAPGGGTSNAVNLQVTLAPPSPTLTPNMTQVLPGTIVSVTLAAGPGGPGDWLSLARVGDPDQAFFSWTYVGGGTAATWTIAVPSTQGNYEFRLFSNNTFMRLATSATVTVQ